MDKVKSINIVKYFDASEKFGYAIEAVLQSGERLYYGLLPGSLKWPLFEARMKRDRVTVRVGDSLAVGSDWVHLGVFRLAEM